MRLHLALFPKYPSISIIRCQTRICEYAAKSNHSSALSCPSANLPKNVNSALRNSRGISRSSAPVRQSSIRCGYGSKKRKIFWRTQMIPLMKSLSSPVFTIRFTYRNIFVSRSVSRQVNTADTIVKYNKARLFCKWKNCALTVKKAHYILIKKASFDAFFIKI